MFHIFLNSSFSYITPIVDAMLTNNDMTHLSSYSVLQKKSVEIPIMRLIFYLYTTAPKTGRFFPPITNMKIDKQR